MAKTETVRVEGVSRTWLPPLDVAVPYSWPCSSVSWGFMFSIR